MRMPMLALLAAVMVLAPTLAQEREISQWATNVTDVQPYDTPVYYWGFFTSKQAIGPYNVYPNYGHLAGAWSFNTTFLTSIQLAFEHAVYISTVAIYETYHGGSVVSIALQNPASGQFVDVFAVEEPTLEKAARIFEPQIEATGFRTNSILLILNCTVPICEIDAVSITGTLPTDDLLKDGMLSEYAEDVVDVSSEIVTSDSAFTARNVLGAPNVWPKNHDQAGDWDQWTEVPYSTFIEISFATSVKAKYLEVFEPWFGGGVYQVSLRNPAGQLVEVWSGKAKYPREIPGANVFKHDLQPTDFYTNIVRIDINSQGYKSRSIDAIRLTGEPCFTNWTPNENTVMIDHEEIASILTLRECKKYCMDSASCIGIDWNKLQGMCYINDKISDTNPETEYDHYSLKRCEAV